MIYIEKVNEDILDCNVCKSKNNLKIIGFVRQNTSNNVRLCEKCRKELRNKLKEEK